MSASNYDVDYLSRQLEQLLAKKAAITSPLDDEIKQLAQKIDGLKPPAGFAVPSIEADLVSNDVLVALVAACASDNTNAFARAGRLLFKANVKISSIRSERKLSLLHTSSRFGSVKILNQMLESEPNLLNILDDLGRDALMMSVLYRQLHAFHILARCKDSSYAHQSLPFHNNCLHIIAQCGLISFARELLNTQRSNESRVQVAMTQYNSDGLYPIHIMAARLDTEMITQAASVNSQWLDAFTATGMNIIDMAITCRDGMLSPRACFAFICSMVVLASKSRDKCLDYLAHVDMLSTKSFADAVSTITCKSSACSQIDADDHDAMLDLLQAFFKHHPPVFDNHYILRYLSNTVCSKKDGAILKRIIDFSRENDLRHVLFTDNDTPPSFLASKCGNLSSVIALQDDGTFDCISRDIETGLNAVQFAIVNGHDNILQHVMSLPDISVIISNTSSFGDTSLHILALSSLPDDVAAQRALQFIGFGLKCGARNCDGLTASDIAASRNMPELLNVLTLHHTRQIQFYRSACLSLCESGDFAKFKSLYEEESICFAAGTGDNACLIAICVLYDVQSIFRFLLQRSVLRELVAIHDGSKLPLLLHTAIALHRNTMFSELFNAGIGMDDRLIFVKCAHVAFQSCNWSLVRTLFQDSRCDLGSESSTTCALIHQSANSLHAPSVLLLLQTIQSRRGAEYLKNCINTPTPDGLTILNVLMLLLRSCERDPSSTSLRTSCCISHHDMVSQCIETMRHFINFGANPNFSDSQGSSLAEFCRANLTKETSALVLNLFSQPDVIRSQMIECVIANDSGSLTSIIQQHGITEAVDEHGLNLAFLAGTLGHLSCFQVLFRLVPSPEILRNFGSLSLLHSAALRGKISIVSFLVESGFDLNFEADDGSGHTPLLSAVVHGHIDVIQLLIQHGASTNHQDSMGFNCLCIALHHRAFACALWLLSQPFAADLLNQVTKLNETVLHIAVGALDRVDPSSESMCKNVVYLIIQGSKSVFDNRSFENITAVEKAIQLQRTWFIKSLTEYASAVLIDSIFERNFDPESPLNLYSNPNAVDHNHNPVLHVAVCMRNAVAVQYLVAAGADVNRVAPDGWSPLLASSALGDCAICETLLKSSANIHATLGKGYNCTPLQLAAAGGKSDIISRLLALGATLDARNDLGLNAIHLALLHGQREAAFTLISSAKTAGKGSSAIAELLRTPHPPLMHRLICSDIPEAVMMKCVNLLLMLGYNIDDKDEEGRSPMQVALAENLPLVAATLCSHAKNINGDNRAALFAAADTCNSSALSRMLSQCPDLNCREFFDHGRPLLHAVVRAGGSSGDSAMIECIRKMCKDPQCNIDIADDQGWTPLHVATVIGSSSYVSVLLESGAECDSTSLSSSALHSALKMGLVDCADQLLRFGANLMNPLGPHGQFSCIVAAVSSGFSTLVNRVIDHMKMWHCHSLRQACEFQVAIDGATLPLLWLEHSKAADEETLSVLKTLSLGGSNILQCNHSSVAPFQIATARSFHQTARFISSTAQSSLMSLLSCPSPSPHVRVDISNCIASGARMDVADNAGLLPLHVCASIGSAAALEVLASSPALQQNAALNAADAYGHNALCHAASNGRADLVPILYRLKVSHLSSCGCSALAHAVIAQKVECVRVLGKLQSSHDATVAALYNPSLGVDTLQLACAIADADVLKCLLEMPLLQSSIKSMFYDDGGSIVHYLTSLNHHTQHSKDAAVSDAGTTASTPAILAEILVRAGAAFLRRNSQGHTAIDLFRLSGDIQTADVLQELGGGVLMKLNQDLVAAAAEGGSDTVDKLINDGADIDWVPSAGSGSGIGTALHRASRNGHEDVVRILLERRASVDYIAPGGRTPLHEAISSGYANIVSLLLQGGASTTLPCDASKGQPGLSALEMALSYHQFTIAHLLINHESQTGSQNSSTHLHLAIIEGDADAVDFLLDVPLAEARKLVASSSSAASASALLNAVLTCKSSDEIRLRIISTLRRAGLATESFSPATDANISEDIRQLLLQPTSDFVTSSTHSVFEAIACGSRNVLEQWLACGLDMSSCLASDGSTLIHACVAKGAVDMLELVLSSPCCSGGIINTKSSSGLTALHIAAKLDRSSCISPLLAHSADLNVAADAACDNNTPLLFAAAHNSHRAFTSLLASGADVFAVNRLGLNVLHVAAAVGNTFTIQSMLSHLSSVETQGARMQSFVAAVSLYGDTPLHLCVLSSGIQPLKALKCCFLLLQGGASPKIRNKDGKSCIELAEETGRRELAHLFRRVSLGAHESTYKVTLLSMAKSAISVGDIDSFADILKEETNVVLNDVLPDMEGDTCLHFAATLPFTDVISLILQQQSSIVTSIGSQGRHALHFAASSGHVDNIRQLLDAGANIDAVANDGSTALILSCAKGHASVARALVERDCQCELFDASGMAAIHHAARACHIECISVLAASSNALDSRRDPPLYHALISSCNCEQITEAVNLLLKLGASPIVPCPSAANSSPGSVAHVLGYKQLASVLIEASGSFGCKWGDVMMSAAEMNDTETLSRALALAGSVNMRDESSGCTAMHHAVRCSSLDALSVLLAAGADCTIKDNVGCSSFVRAALHSNHSALKVILDSMETSTFCALLRLQPIGVFQSLEASCQSFAEKVLGIESAVACGLSPSALSLLVWRLPAAAIMGLDTESLSHFVAICCFVGCEHSAKTIMSRRPSVLSCVHAHGMSILHIAILTGSRNVAQQAILSATTLVNRKLPSISTDAGGLDTPLHLACIGCDADDERSIGELLLAGADADERTSAGHRPRDLLLYTVPEHSDYRDSLITLLDRPVMKMAREQAVSQAAVPVAAAAAAPTAAAAAAAPTAAAAAAAAAAAPTAASVVPTASDDSSGNARDICGTFIDCISQLDLPRFKTLLGSHGLHHSRAVDGATLLHLCAQCGFLQGIGLLLQSKCPMRLDLSGSTALHHAAAANHPLIVSELLCAFPSSLGMCNDAGDTAFITAVRAQSPAVVAVLTAVPTGSSSRTAALAKALSIPGAEGLPPLHLAIKIGALRCAELLLSAQPSLVNFHTPTIPRPLHVAAASLSDLAEGAAKLLLQAGADVMAKDAQGLTAVEVAAAVGNASLARILNNVAAAVADLASLKVSAL